MDFQNDESGNWMIRWQEYHLVHFRLSSGQLSSGILNVRLIQATPLLKPCQDEYLSHSNDKELDPGDRMLTSVVALRLISGSPSTTFSSDGPFGHFSGIPFRNSGDGGICSFSLPPQLPNPGWPHRQDFLSSERAATVESKSSLV